MRPKNNNLFNEEEKSEKEKNPNLKQVSVENVSSIRIDSDFNVEINESYSDKMSAEFQGQCIMGKIIFNAERKGSELVIIAKSKAVVVFSSKATLYVNIPKKYFKNITVSTNNGYISIVGDINTDVLDINSSNGGINVSVPSKKVNIMTSNGDIEYNVNAKDDMKINFQTCNGDILATIHNICSTNIFAATNNGDYSSDQQYDGQYKVEGTIQSRNGDIILK